jgi:peptidoglycan biosynthesis protein MviN/MurJ (putative lipid II flippase)
MTDPQVPSIETTSESRLGAGNCGISLSNVTLSVILNIVLIRQFGLAAIALSTSLMFVAALSLLWWYVGRGRAGRPE